MAVRDTAAVRVKPAKVDPNPGDTCPAHEGDELTRGIDLVGRRYAIPAAVLSWRLSHDDTLLVPGAERDTALVAMLTLERALIEFLRAPALVPVGDDGKPKPPAAHLKVRESVCPWCFAPGWRLRNTDPDLFHRLSARWTTISTHLSHLSWAEAVNRREFTDWKIGWALEGLGRFSAAMRQRHPALADRLASSLQHADAAFALGPTAVH